MSLIADQAVSADSFWTFPTATLSMVLLDSLFRTEQPKFDYRVGAGLSSSTLALSLLGHAALTALLALLVIAGEVGNLPDAAWLGLVVGSAAAVPITVFLWLRNRMPWESAALHGGHWLLKLFTGTFIVTGGVLNS
ncbi:DUF1761 family protein [Nocardia iowensis]|uniref:DUF1761 family protein n=1 Tax=Nocardia iowensis TaxID=204891 RepID=UPI00336C3CA1